MNIVVNRLHNYYNITINEHIIGLCCGLVYGMIESSLIHLLLHTDC